MNARLRKLIQHSRYHNQTLALPMFEKIGRISSEFLLSLIRGNSRNKESDLHHHCFELAGNHQLAGLGTEVLLGRRRHWFSQLGENLR